MLRRVLPLVLVGVCLLTSCDKKTPTQPTPQGKAINVSGDLNFGEVVVGQTRDRSFRIANTGTEPVTVTALTGVSTGFSGSWLSGTIAVGATQDITVRFAPTQARSYGGTLKVAADHTSGTDTIAVTASGTLNGAKFTLTGKVMEAAPTASVAIPNATVTIADGANAGRTAATDGSGSYTIADLTPGGFNINATAAGFQQSGVGVDLTSSKEADIIRLKPNPTTVDQTITGSISAGDSTCSDGTFTKPCKRHSLPIHNPGLVEIDMEFTGGSNDLDLSLWANGSLLVRSTGVTGRERVSTNVSGGASYEVRVTYYEGSTVSNYTLRVRRPN